MDRYPPHAHTACAMGPAGQSHAGPCQRHPAIPPPPGSLGHRCVPYGCPEGAHLPDAPSAHPDTIDPDTITARLDSTGSETVHDRTPNPDGVATIGPRHYPGCPCTWCLD